MFGKLLRRNSVEQRPDDSETSAKAGRFGSALTAAAYTGGVAATVLLVHGLSFSNPPLYQIGEIARNTVRAVQTFTVEDLAATEDRRAAAAARSPVVFDFDPRISRRLEDELRIAFQAARETLAAKAEGEDPEELLESRLPALGRGGVVEAFLSVELSPALEDQAARALLAALEYPGVVSTRDLLERYFQRGILVRDAATGRRIRLEDLTPVRDLDEARRMLRENRNQLAAAAQPLREALAAAVGNWVAPNLLFNENETRLAENAARHETPPVLIQVRKGSTVVRAGEEVSPQEHRLLLAMRQGRDSLNTLTRLVGLALLLGLLFVGLRLILPAGKGAGRFAAIAGIWIAVLATVKLALWIAELVADGLAAEEPTVFVFVAPFALGGLIVALLFDLRAALAYALVFSATAALMTADPRLFLYSLASNLAGALILERSRERTVLAKAGLAVGGVNALAATGLLLYAGFSPAEWPIYLWGTSLAAAGGLLAAMAASVTLPVLESALGTATDIRLLELSNLNAPILRRLASEAPGTYHHSLVVGTLGEAAAEAIGANSLLVRVGAYYHDIGKLKNPDYYSENQIYHPDSQNRPSPRVSGEVLAGHVAEGLEMADEIRLVPSVRELIAQHHGTRLMSYLFRKGSDPKFHRSGQVGREPFRYPGPKPQSPEAAILMTADQLEAASRSLEDRGADRVRGLIRRLIQTDVEDGQFDESRLRIGDLKNMAEAFERVLTGMFHQRIEYPGLEFEEGGITADVGSQRVQ